MANYRLTHEAEADLLRIYRRGVKDFGEAQADAYYLAFFQRFEQIAAQPLLYTKVDHIREGYRRSVCGVDSIYYPYFNIINKLIKINLYLLCTINSYIYSYTVEMEAA